MELRVQDIYKSFGANQVLKGINLTAQSGKAMGVLGRNGAGKTTLIRIVMQVFGADSGQVLLDGKPFDRNTVRVGYLPEERGMYPKKGIIDQLVYFGMLAGMRAGDAKKSALTLIDRLELQEYGNRKLMTLSKGNQQKVQFVATLIADPDIVVLDEPFSGLDPVNAMLLKDLVRELIAKNKIVFFSSHQMNYIEEFCDEIAIMNQGVIALGGSIRDIKRRGERNRLELQSENQEALMQLLQAQTNLVKAVEAQRDALVVTLHNESDKDALLQLVFEKGGSLDAFAVHEPSLSDIFVAVTGDAKTPQEA